MKLKRLLSVLDVCECTADPELDVRDISFDSRTTQPGDLFAAVCGYESDGHRFIGAAVARGAAVVLCQKKPEVDIPYILVADSRLALSRICCEFFGNPSRELTMIGVTGTNGKTTVTTLIKHMLEQCLHTKVGLIGTNANIIGDEVLHTEHTTPDTYELQKLLRRMVDAGCTHAVMEVSSHSLVLHRVEGIRFRVGIFTNLSQDHLDFHKTMEAYAEAKALLFAQSDIGIVNADDEWAHVMLERAKCPMQTYSAKRNDADLVAKDIRLSASGVRFVAMSGDAIARMRLGIPGMFSVYNALSVIACARALGISAFKDIYDFRLDQFGIRRDPDEPITTAALRMLAQNPLPAGDNAFDDLCCAGARAQCAHRHTAGRLVFFHPLLPDAAASAHARPEARHGHDAAALAVFDRDGARGRRRAVRLAAERRARQHRLRPLSRRRAAHGLRARSDAAARRVAGAAGRGAGPSGRDRRRDEHRRRAHTYVLPPGHGAARRGRRGRRQLVIPARDRAYDTAKCTR